jgi:UrcA family protein
MIAMNAAPLIRHTSLACLALGSVLLAGAALATAPAADGASARSLTIHYADVNLATVAGATTLYHRIQGAARFVCGEEGRSLAGQQAWKACYQSAVDEAVAAVNDPTLKAVHLGREAPVAAMLGR